jgi:asparagine synthase (glutamine-hydrolysing)
MLAGLDQVMVAVFRRTLDSIGKNRTIVVPLSGGLDSRCIVAMLHRLGVRSVLCYSYGLPGNRESRISRKVATGLGYRWEFVEYTRELWESMFSSGQMDRIMDYSCNAVSLPHLQDFPALFELDRRGILPPDAVLMPGHTIFNPVRQQRVRGIEPGESASARFDDDILSHHYSLWRWDDPELRQIFLRHMHEALDHCEITDEESFVDGIDRFDYMEEGPKFLTNSIRNYEYFGREWRLPLLDRELIRYTLALPARERIERRLFKRYLSQCLLTGPRRSIARIEATCPLGLPIHLLHTQRNRLRIVVSRILRLNTYTPQYFPLLEILREQDSAMQADLAESLPSIADLTSRGYNPPGINSLQTLSCLTSFVKKFDVDTE